MWEVDIPQIALSSEIVLNALFAVSTLYMLASNFEDQVLSRASTFYLDIAVKKHRLAVETINAETAEPLLVAGVLVCFYTSPSKKEM